MDTAISRRDLMGLGAAAAMAAAAGAVAAQAEETASGDVRGASDEMVGGTPASLAAMGGSTMPLEELNRRRRELIDSKGDYEGPDGTVTPALWNKLRTVIDVYGQGCGSAKKGAADFGFLQSSFTEEEAQAYLEMPMGVMFNAPEFAEASGRSEQECAEICESLASRGLLFKANRGGIPYYHQLTLMHGIGEYNLNRYWEDDYWSAPGASFADLIDFGEGESGKHASNAGTSFYFSIPCSREVVTDDEVLPFDDWRAIVERHSVIAVSPCQCRMTKPGCLEVMPRLNEPALRDYVSPVDGHPLETCLTFGEEAEYYIERGIGRQISQEEATSILERSVDAGLVIQSAFTRENAVICQCHGDCCTILGFYAAMGPEFCASCATMPNYSHYNLDYDKDACLKCGACVERCPMSAISLDEDGYPVVNACCVRCGQCGMVCPVGARTLSAKSKDEYVEVPASMMDDYNLKAAYRFEHDMIH